MKKALYVMCAVVGLAVGGYLTYIVLWLSSGDAWLDD